MFAIFFLKGNNYFLLYFFKSIMYIYEDIVRK
jgi:hypothetical protein